MNTSIWNGVPKQIFKLLISFVISWFTVMIVFASVFPIDDDTGKYDGAMMGLALALTIIVNFIIEFNNIQRLKSRIQKSERDIEYVESMKQSLISKAEKVKDKLLDSEKDVFSGFAKSRGGNRRIKSSIDFKAVVESYPEFQSNEATQKLLNQLEKTEATLLDARVIYSDIVATYNTNINSFPGILIKKACGFKDIEIKSVSPEEDIISDEELGI